MNLNALLKKRQRLEAQIAEAQRLDKRRREVLGLLERAGALDMGDARILEAIAASKKSTITPTGEQK